MVMNPLYEGKLGPAKVQDLLAWQTAHTLYHTTCRPSLVHCEEPSSSLPLHTRSGRMADRPLAMHSPAFSVVGSDFGITRANSGSSRRSVKAMKTLLPLKLSPRLGQPLHSPASTFGTPLSPDAESRSILDRRRDKIKPSARLPMKVQPDRYRDVPFYNEVGSPKPDRPYFSDDDAYSSCSSSSSSCDESCVFQEYESSIESDSDFGSMDRNHGLGFDFSGANPRSDPSKAHQTNDSDFSFKCRGDPNAFGTALFPDEASWLSGSVQTMNALVESQCTHSQSPLPSSFPVQPNEESYLSDASSDESDDELGCATALTLPTALTPSKAQVVDVPSPRLSFASRTLRRYSSIRASSAGRKSRMTFRNSSLNSPQKPSFFSGTLCQKSAKDSTLRPANLVTARSAVPRDNFDLARATPPLTPKDIAWKSDEPPARKSSPGYFDPYSSTTRVEEPRGDIFPFESCPEALVDTICFLEQSLGNFPSMMLLPEMPCITSIRSHLALSSSQSSSFRKPNFATDTDWRPEHWASPHGSMGRSQNLHKSISLSTLSTFRTSPASRSPYDGPQRPLSPQHFSTTMADRSLQEVFPNSSPFLRAALYSHVIAYTFLDSLTSPSVLPESSGLPHIFTTTSHALPPKVAKVLGAPPMAAKPTRIRIHNSAAVISNGADSVEMYRIEQLRDRARGCIGWLAAEMENPHSQGSQQVPIDGITLRSLVELVKSFEQHLNILV